MRSSTSPVLLAAVLVLAGFATAGASDAIRRIPGVTAPQVDPTTPGVPARPDGGKAPVGATTGPAVLPVTSSAPGGSLPATAGLPAVAGRDADRFGLSVMVNRAKVIRLPERASTVVVGNPAIADLTLQKNGIVIVTGKSFGVTNLLALDAAGNMLAESLVSVVPQTDGMLVVQRAFQRYSYACTPNCQPSVSLGDEKTFFEDARGQADAHNQFAGSR